LSDELDVDPWQHERALRWRRIVDSRGARYALCQLSEFHFGNDEHSVQRAAACKQVAEFCQQLEVSREKRNLIFAGPPGTGKDHLMFYALRFAVMRCGTRAAWIDGQRLFSDLRDGITEGKAERETLGELIRADVLAISDPVPPNASLTDHQRNMLFRLIDDRYSHYRPTWMTVNAANPQELDQRMGVSLVDRLLHDAVAVNCYWPSYRRVSRR